MMMRVAIGTRELLLDLATDGKGDWLPMDSASVMPHLQAELKGEKIAAIYEGEPLRGRRPPSLIVLGGEDTKDFFAWVSTYLSQWSPLTATTQVMKLSDPDLRAVLKGSGYSLREHHPSFTRALAAVALAESLWELRSSGKDTFPTVQAVRSTFSFAIGKALCSRFKPQLSPIATKMAKLDEAFSLPQRHYREQLLREFWN